MTNGDTMNTIPNKDDIRIANRTILKVLCEDRRAGYARTPFAEVERALLSRHGEERESYDPDENEYYLMCLHEDGYIRFHGFEINYIGGGREIELLPMNRNGSQEDLWVSVTGEGESFYWGYFAHYEKED